MTCGRSSVKREDKTQALSPGQSLLPHSKIIQGALVSSTCYLPTPERTPMPHSISHLQGPNLNSRLCPTLISVPVSPISKPVIALLSTQDDNLDTVVAPHPLSTHAQAVPKSCLFEKHLALICLFLSHSLSGGLSPGPVPSHWSFSILPHQPRQQPESSL